jgi:hypothetical protein
MREEESMKEDMRTWVEAAIGLYVRDGVPIADTPVALVDQLLAEILVYCGYDVPEKFRGAGEGDLLEAARSQGVLVGLDPLDAGRWAGAAQQALVTGDWASISDLPSEAWRWISTLTGLDRDQWELMPSHADSLLDSEAECPICKQRGKLRDIGRFTKVWEPLGYGGGGSLTVKCSHCGERLVLARDDTLRPGFKHWGAVLVWGAVLSGAAVLMIVFLVLWHFFSGGH